MDAERYWSPEDMDRLKDLKLRREELSDLAGSCWKAISDIFKLLLEKIPSSDEEEAAMRSLNCLSTLVGIVDEQQKYFEDILLQLEDKRLYLEMMFGEEDALWAEGEAYEDRDRS